MVFGPNARVCKLCCRTEPAWLQSGVAHSASKGQSVPPRRGWSSFGRGFETRLHWTSPTARRHVLSWPCAGSQRHGRFWRLRPCRLGMSVLCAACGLASLACLASDLEVPRSQVEQLPLPGGQCLLLRAFALCLRCSLACGFGWA